MSETFFATCPRGLEALLADELSALGATAPAQVPGGVSFRGDWRMCYAANLESRLATRILWRVAHGRYAREDDVFRLAYDVDWPALFPVECTLRVYVTAIRSPLRSLDFITLRVKDAVCDRFRAACDRRPYVDTAAPDVRVHLFLTHDQATLYLDTSGEPLYKRGFKAAAVEAPLKENLAAGILRLAGWQPGIPLLDPMCGSGTFLLEAAQHSLDIAPGLVRGFGFERLQNFDERTWRALQDAARARVRPAASLPIFGSDVAADQVQAARHTLAAAGLASCVHLEVRDIVEVQAPAPAGVLIANPPYGVRLATPERLAALYPRIGDTLKRRFAGWRCYLFSADPELPKRIGLKASRRTPLYNGAIECRLYEYRIVAGSMRREKKMPDPGSRGEA